MGVVAITADRNTWTGTRAKGGKRSYGVTYRVQVDSLSDGPQYAMDALPIILGQPYALFGDSDNNSFVTQIGPAQGTDGKLWLVPVQWTEAEGEEEQENPNPVARPIIWTYGHETYTRVLAKDVFGKAILNSAGEAFDPPVEIEDSRPIFTATRNLTKFDNQLAERFQQAVNNGSFKGFPKGTVKCNGISADGPNFENDVTYFVVRYEFAVRWDKWLPLEVLDQGRNQRPPDDDEGELIPIRVKDEDGNDTDDYVDDPVPLDGEGRRLENPKPDTVKYIEVKAFRERSFSELGLE